jgi:hypothetical protein
MVRIYVYINNVTESSFSYSQSVLYASFFLVLKSKIRKFLGSFCCRKSENFLCVPARKLQIRKFFSDLSPNRKAANLSGVPASPLIAIPQIFHYRTFL